MRNFHAIAARAEVEAEGTRLNAAVIMCDHERFAPSFIPDATVPAPIGNLGTGRQRRAFRRSEEDQWPA
jgi:hypothetical protein